MFYISDLKITQRRLSLQKKTSNGQFIIITQVKPSIKMPIFHSLSDPRHKHMY